MEYRRRDLAWLLGGPLKRVFQSFTCFVALPRPYKVTPAPSKMQTRSVSRRAGPRQAVRSEVGEPQRISQAFRSAIRRWPGSTSRAKLAGRSKLGQPRIYVGRLSVPLAVRGLWRSARIFEESAIGETTGSSVLPAFEPPCQVPGGQGYQTP